MTANRCMAIGVITASLVLVPIVAVGALDTTPTTTAAPIKAACADTADTYFLHVAVGASLENVDEYVNNIRDMVHEKSRRLVRALKAYDRASTIPEYARAIRRVVGWCTRTYGRL
jgi:hypothetical protein